MPKSTHGLTDAQLDVIKHILRPFAAKMDRVGLFGSRATGNYRENSDIDLVIYGTLSQEDTDRLWTLFDDSNLSIKVDVHTYQLIAYAPLKDHVDEEMIVLFSGEELRG